MSLLYNLFMTQNDFIARLIERFKADTGHYPARILADKLFRTRDNLDYCKKRGIRMSGPKLGRPPKDPKLYQEQLRVEREESGGAQKLNAHPA